MFGWDSILELPERALLPGAKPVRGLDLISRAF
jgi:hypothetical protein